MEFHSFCIDILCVIVSLLEIYDDFLLIGIVSGIKMNPYYFDNCLSHYIISLPNF